MYKIEKKHFGLQLTFGGYLKKEELDTWKSESATQLVNIQSPFGVLIDMRELKPLTPDAQEVMVSGQMPYKNAGMQRSAVILNSATLTMQFVRLAKTSGIYAWERYFDASSDPSWEDKTIDWLKNGIDAGVAA
jgi:hypothetical protein